jgi:hypothetical protein
MKKIAFIMTLSLLTSVIIYAQDNKPSNPQPDSIIRIIPIGVGRYSTNLFTIGGRLQAPEDVAIRLLSYQPSATEYAKARNNFTWTYISFGGFAIAGFAAVIDYAHNNKHAGETTGLVNGAPGFIYQQHSLTGAYILTGVATGFLVSTIINAVNAQQHGKRALQLYNRRFE